MGEAPSPVYFDAQEVHLPDITGQNPSYQTIETPARQNPPYQEIETPTRQNLPNEATEESNRVSRTYKFRKYSVCCAILIGLLVGMIIGVGVGVGIGSAVWESAGTWFKISLICL